MVDLVGQVDRITRQIARYPSVNGTSDRSLMASVNQLAAGLNTAANNPNADLSALSALFPIIMKVTDASSAHVSVDVARLAIGALPDPNNPADPGARMPDGTDWANFAGSLEYQLNRLKDRVIGPGR